VRIGVYEGTSVDALTDTAGSSCSGDAIFYAEAGTTYRIAVDSDDDPAGGTYALELEQTTATPNVVLAEPLTLTAGSGKVRLKETTGAKGLYVKWCKVDGSTTKAGCHFDDGQLYFDWKWLQSGTHTLEVAVRDGVFNDDPTPLTHTWTVDSTPPETTITSPTPPLGDLTPTLTFASNEPKSTFACSHNGGPWIACSSPWTWTVTTKLGEGFRVRATDAVGNTDVTHAELQWMHTSYGTPVVPAPAIPAPRPVTTASTTSTTGPATASAAPSPSGVSTGALHGSPRCSSDVSHGKLTRRALRRGVTLRIFTAPGCRLRARVARRGRTLGTWSGAGPLLRARLRLRAPKAGAGLTLRVAAANAAGTTTSTQTLRVRR
jgi:hypothetical protein